MYLSKTPDFIKPIANNLVWNLPNDMNRVFLTFDDGPIPKVTPWVLKQLEKHDAKATFFMVGENVKKHHDIARQVESAGHSIGNHTEHHLKGWKNSTFTYARNTLLASESISSPLFRPPYGKMSRAQSKALRSRFTIVMWDVLSGDFDATIPSDIVVKNVLDNVQSGSIIVMHDSLKAESHLRHALPIILKELKNSGYSLESIPMVHCSPRTTNLLSAKHSEQLV